MDWSCACFFCDPPFLGLDLPPPHLRVPSTPPTSFFGLSAHYTRHLSMPLRSKRSRAAKQVHQNAQAGFAARAASPEPEGLEYSIWDNLENVNGHNESDIQGGNEVKTSVETLQCLYSTVLPPHLRRKEGAHTKKTNKRKSVYTGDSRTTRWRKSSALKRAAEGCMTLDVFVVRGGKRVCLLSVR